MYQALGYGKGDTVLAVVAIVIGCPAYVFFSLVAFFFSLDQKVDCIPGRGYSGITANALEGVADMRIRREVTLALTLRE
jgi:hypothetical protein